MAAFVLIQPQPRAGMAAQVLQRDGHQTVVCSFASLQPDASALDALRALALEDFDRVVFVSPSSVFFSAPVLRGRLRDEQVAAVGQGTATVLLETGLVTDDTKLTRPRMPPFDVGALTALASMQPGVINRLLVVRGHEGRSDWQQPYIDAGVQVQQALIYHANATQPDAQAAAQLHALSAQGAQAVIIVGSISQWRSLQAWLTDTDDPQLQLWLPRCPAVVPHARIGAALTKHGWRQVVPTKAGETLLQAACTLAESR